MLFVKVPTCTTTVHLGSANKFRVWMARGENEKIGSARREKNRQLPRLNQTISNRQSHYLIELTIEIRTRKEKASKKKYTVRHTLYHCPTETY